MQLQEHAALNDDTPNVLSNSSPSLEYGPETPLKMVKLTPEELSALKRVHVMQTDEARPSCARCTTVCMPDDSFICVSCKAPHHFRCAVPIAVTTMGSGNLWTCSFTC